MTRLEEIKEKSKIKKSKYPHINLNDKPGEVEAEYKEEVTGLSEGDFEWVIEQARLYQSTNEYLSPKLAKLNEFVQKRNAGEWGGSVIDGVMEYVEELEEEIETWEIGFGMLDRIKEYFEEKSRDLERENQRLKKTLSYYADPKIYDARHGMEILRDSGDKARRELEGDESDTKEMDRRR